MNKLIALTGLGRTENMFYDKNLDSLDDLNFVRVPTHFEKFDEPITLNIAANAIEAVEELEIPVLKFSIVVTPRKKGFLGFFRGSKRELKWETVETVKVSGIRTVSKNLHFVRESKDEINALMKGDK